MFIGSAVVEFNVILLKGNGKQIDHIQTDLNERICITTDENSNDVEIWIEENKKRNMDMQGYPVTDYSYQCSQRYIHRKRLQLTNWIFGIPQVFGALMLYLGKTYTQGWKYAKLHNGNVMEYVNKLMLHSFRK